MAVTDPATVLIGVFEDRRQAEQYVEELKRAGFRDNQVGLMRRDGDGSVQQAEEGAAAGAITGGALGAVAGAVATGLIPGVGPVIAGTLLAGTLGGAAAAATAGGLVGALISLGVTEDEAHRYDSHFRAGRTLVVVKGNGRLAEAVAILRRHKQAP